MHDSGIERFLLDLREGGADDARGALLDEWLERYKARFIARRQSAGAATSKPHCSSNMMPICGSTQQALSPPWWIGRRPDRRDVAEAYEARGSFTGSR
jgi:hypothetical protein